VSSSWVDSKSGQLKAALETALPGRGRVTLVDWPTERLAYDFQESTYIGLTLGEVSRLELNHNTKTQTRRIGQDSPEYSRTVPAAAKTGEARGQGQYSQAVSSASRSTRARTL